MKRADQIMLSGTNRELDELLDQVFLDLNPDDPSDQVLLEAVSRSIMGDTDSASMKSGEVTNRFALFVRNYWVGLLGILLLGGIGTGLLLQRPTAPAQGAGMRSMIIYARAQTSKGTGHPVIDIKPETRITPLFTGKSETEDIRDTIVIPATHIREEDIPATVMTEMDTVPVSAPVLRNWRPGNDWERFGLRGRVRSVSEVSYKLEKGPDGLRKGKRKRPAARWGRDYATTFNESGCRVTTVRYNSDGSIYRNQFYLCNDQGSVIEEKIKQGRSAETVRRFQRSYDTHGNETGVLHLNQDGSLQSKDIYEYDSLSRLVRDIFVNHKGVSQHVFENRYGSNNRVSETRQYAADSSLVMIIYDTFNSEDVRLKSTAYLGFDSRLFHVTEYDEYENPIRQRWYDHKDRCHTDRVFEYTYDNQGNWIQSRVFENNKPKYLLERKFEYFE